VRPHVGYVQNDKMFFDAFGIQKQMYEVAEKHLALEAGPTEQVDGWNAIETQVR
jgi:hypothetical protein